MPLWVAFALFGCLYLMVRPFIGEAKYGRDFAFYFAPMFGAVIMWMIAVDNRLAAIEKNAIAKEPREQHARQSSVELCRSENSDEDRKGSAGGYK